MSGRKRVRQEKGESALENEDGDVRNGHVQNGESLSLSLPIEDSKSSKSSSRSSPSSGGMSGDLDSLETDHLRGILRSFVSYRKWMSFYVGRLQEGVNRMPTRFVERLEPFYLDKLGRMQQCIDRNQPFLDAISGVGLWINADLARQQYDPKQDRLGVSSMNMDKVEVVLKQFCRDWCVDGQAERDMCYKPVFDYVTQHFSSQQQHSHATRILCPGCGLARLPWEFSREGYYAEGNEYTHFMILATLYTLSYDLKKRGTTQIYPWAANSSNHLSIDSQCAPISIPDVDPSEHKVMIQAGNFNEIYRTPDHVGAWQCVASCFLLDATENMLSTLETIHRILEMGGIWVNIGPLLYHHGDRQMGVNFANAERVRQSAEAEFKRYGYSAEPLVELTAEELKLILPSFGFEVLEWRTGLPTVYNMHKDSMQTTSYNALFFAVKKVPIPTPTPASESTLPSTEFTAHSN